MSVKELMAFQRPRMARWWLPDRVFFVPEIPMTATGESRPTVLREHYHEILLLKPPRGGRNVMPWVDPLRWSDRFARALQHDLQNFVP